MFEAYKVAVRLTLINNVSSGLISMSRQFAGAGKEADALQAKINKLHLQKTAMLGVAMTGAGFFGLEFISKAIKPAEQYVHQLNIMNMAGMKQAEIAEAVGDAWKLTGQNITTTASGNLKALLDLRNVTGNWKESREFLPIMQRMQTVLAASKDGQVNGHSGDLAFSAMKALDIRGAVNDPETLKRQADLMARVIIGTQGRVTPEQYQSVFNYARQAKFALSDDFAYKILPTLMLENAGKSGGGGGSKGVGPAIAALHRFTNQGYVNRKSLPLLQELGMLGHGKILPTTTTGTVVAPLKDAALARSNSFEWTNQVLAPAVVKYLKRHHMSASDDNVLQIINMASRGNQLAGGLLGEFYIKRKNFERDRLLMEGVMSPELAYKSAMTKDPGTAHLALSAAWENFETSLTVNAVPILVPALLDLSKGLNKLGAFARENPELTKDLVIGVVALSGVMAVGGPLITGVAMTRIAFGGLGSSAVPLPGLLGKTATGLGAVAAKAGIFMAAYAGWELGDKAGGMIDRSIAKNSHYAESSLRDRMARTSFGRFTGLFDYGQDESLHFVQAPSMAPHQSAGNISFVRPGAQGGNANNHFTVQIDGEDVRHKITKDMPISPSRGSTGINQMRSPLAPSLGGAF